MTDAAPITPTGSWTIAPEAYDSPAAAALWRTYYTEVSDRWYLLHDGRPTDPAELERGIAEETGADLAPPDGVLLVARFEGEPVGTAGVRLRDANTAELKRVFVRKGMRGRGGAPRLIAAAEDAARALGAELIVLDTRTDLVESRTLYTRCGFEETEPYNDDPYSQHWFAKKLASGGGAG
ncbi:GNAT family N-acetyltransferase [Streptomyces sp. NPDC041068]|uniref:GNAT family N-acetyltransferase n=1 Tax=Streptomyces sp. NPDC041068 TaxID=3155130 RepID=UPI0033EE41D1